MPKVSVIIPTYNRENEIARALKSVQDQTFQDYEVLVCDDASTDATRSVVTAYASRDYRIHLLCLPKNQGAGAARNIGMEAAKGHYIAFLDSDDEWLPEKLECQVKVMDAQPTNIGVCFTGGHIIKNGDLAHPIIYSPEKRWEHDTLRKFIMGRILFLTPTILFRRSCLKKTGLMRSAMRRNQDLEFLLRLFYNYALIIIPNCYSIVHMVVSSKRKKTFEAMKQALPHHLSHLNSIRKRFGYWPSTVYQANCYSRVIAAAIRERRWGEATAYLLQKLQAFPILLPRDIHQLSRAFIASYKTEL